MFWIIKYILVVNNCYMFIKELPKELVHNISLVPHHVILT